MHPTPHAENWRQGDLGMNTQQLLTTVMFRSCSSLQHSCLKSVEANVKAGELRFFKSTQGAHSQARPGKGSSNPSQKPGPHFGHDASQVCRHGHIPAPSKYHKSYSMGTRRDSGLQLHGVKGMSVTLPGSMYRSASNKVNA